VRQFPARARARAPARARRRELCPHATKRSVAFYFRRLCASLRNDANFARTQQCEAWRLKLREVINSQQFKHTDSDCCGPNLPKL
jgi:hypothetical protein